jgi:xanthine dehydrogenase accessory factor
VCERPIVIIRGGGDLGSGCALRLARTGFRVLVTEIPAPTVVRRTVAFAEAVFDGVAHVEGIPGILVTNRAEIASAWGLEMIPVIVDPDLTLSLRLHPDVLIDATVAKHNLGTRRDMAPGTIALGPGFVAGIDVDAVVETNRGPNLGRVLWHGSAETDTGVPAPVSGQAAERVLRAPTAGWLCTSRQIGEIVRSGEVIAEVGGQMVRAPFDGLIRGLLRPGLYVHAAMKIGDLDPRLQPELCCRVSDKALAVAGGVLEATLMLLCRRTLPAATHNRWSM